MMFYHEGLMRELEDLMPDKEIRSKIIQKFGAHFFVHLLTCGKQIVILERKEDGELEIFGLNQQDLEIIKSFENEF